MSVQIFNLTNDILIFKFKEIKSKEIYENKRKKNKKE